MVKTVKEIFIDMCTSGYYRWSNLAESFTEEDEYSRLASERAKEYQVMLERAKELPDDTDPWEYINLLKNPRH